MQEQLQSLVQNFVELARQVASIIIVAESQIPDSAKQLKPFNAGGLFGDYSYIFGMIGFRFARDEHNLFATSKQSK